MKKKTITIIIIIILLILLFPFRYRLKDGGSTVYKSLTYEITKVHRLHDINEIETGWEITILGKQIYKKTTINVDIQASNE
jgi:hypothetical protein